MRFAQSTFLLTYLLIDMGGDVQRVFHQLTLTMYGNPEGTYSIALLPYVYAIEICLSDVI